MTVCATETTVGDTGTVRHTSFTIAADGAYAARLNASADGGWYPERWTLDGPEPYAVPLPGARPEQADSALLPLADGRVLIARRSAGCRLFALLYPTGPGTGELPLGAVESERLALLPPAPCGRRAYALVPGEHTTGVWLVAGGSETRPHRVAEVPGRCAGGAWLDREGRLLALDRTDTAGGGRTKTVVVDLGRGGEVSPLLQIAEDSDDRLLLADPDSGLLLVRSDAPGEDRLGWGVLGSHRPIRFPECLHPAGARLTPFAVQPGQVLLPESCAVALHGQWAEPRGAGDGEGARRGGPEGWLAVWHPARREVRRFTSPPGWLPGKGVWTKEGELRLPCVTAHAPCGLARLRTRPEEPAAETAPPEPEPAADAAPATAPAPAAPATDGGAAHAGTAQAPTGDGAVAGTAADAPAGGARPGAPDGGAPAPGTPAPTAGSTPPGAGTPGSGEPWSGASPRSGAAGSGVPAWVPAGARAPLPDLAPHPAAPSGAGPAAPPWVRLTVPGAAAPVPGPAHQAAHAQAPAAPPPAAPPPAAPPPAAPSPGAHPSFVRLVYAAEGPLPSVPPSALAQHGAADGGPGPQPPAAKPVPLQHAPLATPLG